MGVVNVERHASIAAHGEQERQCSVRLQRTEVRECLVLVLLRVHAAPTEQDGFFPSHCVGGTQSTMTDPC